ncbi:MAG TPA: hypothetical protein DEA96_03220 [Leptospiraceae bacterium]|nr:hypothetical protein [Spirochaetaceae bacterium]HBS03950.1 hypothetical protein [Leptospiraceae bacterium]|tara:strand:+ start:17587 stop:18990 length:1404 start_codon:yes stop_codon:yes gene_type:complete
MEKRALEQLWDQNQSTRKEKKLVVTLYEILFALVAFANISLVVFDASYLWKIPYARMTFRDVYLDYAPGLVKQYDPVKGIESHRFVDSYKDEIKNLKNALGELAENPANLQARQTSVQSRETLIEMTVDMINRRGVDSHFYLAEKDGVLERIKNKMREEYPNEDDSAKDAFREFFSQENLTPDNYQDKFKFFDSEVMYLMNQNYFRWIGEDGEKKDYFHLIDRWFVLFFLLDFLARWIMAIVQKRYRKWYLFPVRQSYEVFNLFPPHHAAWFRLLRVIPFYMRIRQNGWLPDDGLAPDIIKSNAGIIAEEISGLVVLNILDQTKASLKRTGIRMEGDTRDAVENLLSNQMASVAKKVIPEIQPQISEMVSYSINRAMEPYLLSPIGPIVRLILMSVHATVNDGLEAALSGPEGTERLSRILQNSVSNIMEDMGDPESQEALIEDVIRVLDRVQEDVRESVANRNVRS